MSLTKQVHAFSIGTDAFYDEKEQYYHQRLLKLYKARNEYKKEEKKQNKAIWWQESKEWRKKAINRVLTKEKEKLSNILDERAKDRTPRELNPDSLKEKNVISLFCSSLTRVLNLKPNELTESIIIVNVFFFQVFKNLVLDGFLYKGEKYIFLTASAGQIRQKKAVFIKESSYEKVKDRLTCGLDFEVINFHGGVNPNKYLAYLALNNSATDVWEDFDIDKAIVVDDFETSVPGLVDYISDITY